MTALVIERAGPLTSVQDAGRFGQLVHGVTASGPMDRMGFANAGAALGTASAAGIEFTTAGIALRLEAGTCRIGFSGGDFVARHNDAPCAWNSSCNLGPGDRFEVLPGPAGTYGYVRFEREIDVPLVLGSRATNTRAGFGGLMGRNIVAGDRLALGAEAVQAVAHAAVQANGPVRVIWGLHADVFASAVRQRFVEEAFVVSGRMDRMGVRLEDRGGVFADAARLSLVSEPIVAGDIQILGDGRPIVLMRDHQPTGGYPRIGTVISADLDRFAQLRPGAEVGFMPVTVAHAHAILAGRDI